MPPFQESPAVWSVGHWAALLVKSLSQMAPQQGANAGVRLWLSPSNILCWSGHVVSRTEETTECLVIKMIWEINLSLKAIRHQNTLHGFQILWGRILNLWEVIKIIDIKISTIISLIRNVCLYAGKIWPRSIFFLPVVLAKAFSSASPLC